MPQSAAAERSGLSRRDFVKVCSAAAAAVGLPAWAGEKMAENVAKGKKPSVIWLHFQECTGCTESLLRSAAPDVGELILDLISLDFHETLAAPAGYQFEEVLEKTMKETGRQVRAGRRGRHPAQGRRHLLLRRRQEGHRHAQPGGRQGGGHHRHRLLRLLGRHPVRRRPTRPAPSASPRPSRARPWSPSPAARPTRTTCSARCCSSPPSARCRRSTTRGAPSSPTAASSTRTARAAPTSTTAASRRPSATRGTATAGASTSSAARGRRPTPTARCSTSARCRAPGPSASATRASAAPSRGSSSTSPSTRTCRSTSRPRPWPTRASRRPQGEKSIVAVGLAGLVVGAAAGAGYVASKKLAVPPGEGTKED